MLPPASPSNRQAAQLHVAKAQRASESITARRGSLAETDQRRRLTPTVPLSTPRDQQQNYMHLNAPFASRCLCRWPFGAW